MHRRIISPLILAISLILFLAGGIGLADTPTSDTYILSHLAVEGNSGSYTSDQYQADITTGYTALGSASSNNYQLDLGFLPGRGRAGGPLFLPMIYDSPIPVLPPTTNPYEADWDTWFEFPEGDDDDCWTESRDDQYWGHITDDNTGCLPFAPAAANTRYGEFQVEVYQSGDAGLQGSAAYGLYINGAGGDNYYLFRIWPNNSCSTGGDWELLRNRGGTLRTLAQNECESAIIRGYGGGATNRLKVAHTSDRLLAVFVNGDPVVYFTDDEANHLTGTGTGLYLRSTTTNILIKFETFRVDRYE